MGQSGAFPISRDPPEGGTQVFWIPAGSARHGFQFLGIPPKGEPRPTQRRWHCRCWFPISRDPPEGGTSYPADTSTASPRKTACFQFLGIPPKGEQRLLADPRYRAMLFPISRDPPEGGTGMAVQMKHGVSAPGFPISRDPPEGGTSLCYDSRQRGTGFPISRDPPEGGTPPLLNPSRARNARPICEGSGKKSAKRVLARGLWGRKALWRKASRDRTKESAFAAFGGSLAQALIPFECAFGNTECLSRKRLA